MQEVGTFQMVNLYFLFMEMMETFKLQQKNFQAGI